MLARTLFFTLYFLPLPADPAAAEVQDVPVSVATTPAQNLGQATDDGDVPADTPGGVITIQPDTTDDLIMWCDKGGLCTWQHPPQESKSGGSIWGPAGAPKAVFPDNCHQCLLRDGAGDCTLAVCVIDP